MAISGSVGDWGRGAVNDAEDVATIQDLLTRASQILSNPKYDPKGIDGKIAGLPQNSNTVKAIKEFQRRWMNNPDGIVSPGFKTILDLVKFAGDLPIYDPLGFIRDIFNTPEEPTKKYGKGMHGPSFPFTKTAPIFQKHNHHRRWFGAKRTLKDKVTKEIIGYRKHAGVDLCFRPGTPVYAVSSGTFTLKRLKHFYKGTVELRIDHGDYLCRYCELEDKVAPGLFDKDTVEQGQLIGWVGWHKMVHFEMYENTMTGELSTGSKYTKKWEDAVFNRRRDIMNPTEFLMTWQKNLPDGH